MKKYGYEIETASNGFKAGLKVMEFMPGLIILDLIIPGMDGFEVCGKIKRSLRTANIKVLAVTGFDTPENRARILEAGADDFLSKPLDNKSLMQKVKSLLKIDPSR